MQKRLLKKMAKDLGTKNLQPMLVEQLLRTRYLDFKQLGALYYRDFSSDNEYVGEIWHYSTDDSNYLVTGFYYKAEEIPNETNVQMTDKLYDANFDNVVMQMQLINFNVR